MSYDIFISYEISDSSLAYELVAALGRSNVTYYLDCANSSITMSGYVKGVFEGCRTFIPLVSALYLSKGYARELLSCAVGTNKQVLACFTDDCMLPDEFAAFIPDGYRVNICGGSAGESVWDTVLQLLLARGEETGSVENREESSLPITEDVPKSESNMEVSVGQATATVIDEEKKRAIANLLYVLQTYKEEETGHIRYHKSEPPKTVPLSDEGKKNKKVKTPQQQVWDVILFPFRFVSALFITALFKAPLLMILVVFFVVMKCCDDEPKVSAPKRQEFTKEQIAEGKRINKLATDYYYGRNGVEKDRAKALQYYLQASELGNADATYNVGMCAKLGMGCRKDLDVASHKFYSAVKLGHERAFEELKALAEAGDAEAQNRYGLCFEYGYGTKVILKNAVYWYEQAANQGYSYGQYNLAECYYDGRGVKQNTRVAVKWFRKAAEGGHATAQYELGLFYLDGEGVAKNPYEAYNWISKSAAQGNVDALNQLAYCYAEGVGTDADMGMAHATIDKAIQMYPDEANLYDSKGEFYMMVGDREKAQKMYEKVMEKNPTFYKKCTWSKLYDYINNK